MSKLKNYQEMVARETEAVDFKANRYQVQFSTSKGDILLDLEPEAAPGHCLNLIGLVKSKFYDGLNFHRIIDGFVIQGGCPLGNGTGGPGYHIKAEFNDRPHKLGVLSMARAQSPDSAGSQFFICLGDVPYLDNQYTVFGQAKDNQSLDVIRSIGQESTDGQDRPMVEVKINQAQVLVTPI